MCLPLALDLEKHVYEEDAESVMLSWLALDCSNAPAGWTKYLINSEEQCCASLAGKLY